MTPFKAFINDAFNLLEKGNRRITRQEWHKLLKRHESQTLYLSRKEISDIERLEFTERLLASKTPRPIIRERLMSRYGLSRSMAYEVIGLALNKVN